MLWHKSWVETRSRFLIGLVLLVLSACGAVFFYPQVMKLMPLARDVDTGGELGRQIREGVELARDYRGYIWSQLIRQSLTQMGTLFAVLLGSGGLLSQTSGGTLFMLSLPASRDRVLAVRAATGLAEWLALAIIPCLLLPLISPAVEQRYGVADALTHGACLFAAGAVFFSLALLLSTAFSDLWRPLAITCAVAVVLSLLEGIVRELSPYGIFRLMRAEDYFRTHQMPWLGLIASAAVSAAMLYAATRNLARQDF